MVAATLELIPRPISSPADRLIIAFPLKLSSSFAVTSLIIEVLVIGFVFLVNSLVSSPVALDAPWKK